MQFYINVVDANRCDITGIQRLCLLNNYEFSPNNCGIYYVNTETKKCIGVNKKELDITEINHSYSYKKLKLLFKNKGVQI
jgi:hypothetical protein